MDDRRNFYDQSFSSFDTSHSVENGYSRPISDITLEYDCSQIKYELRSTDELSEDEVKQVVPSYMLNSQDVETRYMKNDNSRYFHLEKFQIKSQSEKRWQKASNDEVLLKLNNLRKCFIKG